MAFERVRETREFGFSGPLPAGRYQGNVWVPASGWVTVSTFFAIAGILAPQITRRLCEDACEEANPSVAYAEWRERLLQGNYILRCLTIYEPGSCPVSFGMRERKRDGAGYFNLVDTREFFTICIQLQKLDRNGLYSQFLDIVGPKGIRLIDGLDFREVRTSSSDYTVRVGGRVRVTKPASTSRDSAISYWETKAFAEPAFRRYVQDARTAISYDHRGKQRFVNRGA